ncbi:MAG: protease inhibitor I9 family protein, partial [Bacteroidia bacterium]|nr:protease inhibitor I9 family protein [Bacteroidia bacterium]
MLNRSITSVNFDQMKEEMKTNAQALFSDNRMSAKTIDHAYVNAIKGVSLKLTANEIEQLRSDRRIAYIEQDQIINV